MARKSTKIMINQYYSDWETVAKLDEVPIESIRVDLICVIYDLCQLFKLDPSEILGDKVGILE